MAERQVEGAGDTGPKIMKKVVRSTLAELPANSVLLNEVGNANFPIARRIIPMPKNETNEMEEEGEKIIAKELAAMTARFNKRKREAEEEQEIDI